MTPSRIHRRKRIPAAAAAVMLFLLSGCKQTAPAPSSSEPEPIRPAAGIIREMIVDYGYGEEDPNGRVDGLLAELRAQDSEKGALWTEIMDYWKYAGHDMQINTGRLPDGLPDGDTLALVVLGYALEPDGSMRSELIDRLNTALACAEQYPDAYVICTGGGTAMNNPDASEGRLMGEWLLANGLSESRLIIEDQSLTTAENAVNSYVILRSRYPQVDSVAVITSDYHIPWGVLMFETVFLQSNADKRTPEMHVVANCACKTDSAEYNRAFMLRCEASGMIQLTEDESIAEKYASAGKQTA